MCNHCESTVANHPDKPEQGEDEDYVDYLGRCATFWSEHPPVAPEGFELIPCECEPRCWPKYTIRDNDFYETYCDTPYAKEQFARIRKLEHAQHRAFWKTKVGRWIIWRLDDLHLVQRMGFQTNSECDGCVTWKFGRKGGAA